MSQLCVRGYGARRGGAGRHYETKERAYLACAYLPGERGGRFEQQQVVDGRHRGLLGAGREPKQPAEDELQEGVRHPADCRDVLVAGVGGHRCSLSFFIRVHVCGHGVSTASASRSLLSSVASASHHTSQPASTDLDARRSRSRSWRHQLPARTVTRFTPARAPPPPQPQPQPGRRTDLASVADVCPATPDDTRRSSFVSLRTEQMNNVHR